MFSACDNPMKVSAQYAEEHLTDILNAADSGAEVEIARPDQPTYRLTLVKSEPTKPKGPRILGAGVGEMRVPPWEEWKAMDKEMEREMLDAPLTTSGEVCEPVR
jgi:antitoxin (DNA-binding transcriptional repressor) of toxin-antitoxin stability system